jgi:hypothetical protein
MLDPKNENPSVVIIIHEMYWNKLNFCIPLCIPPSSLESIMCLLSSYYVFHIHWAADVSLALLFLQQEGLGISDDTMVNCKPLKLFLNLINQERIPNN